MFFSKLRRFLCELKIKIKYGRKLKGTGIHAISYDCSTEKERKKNKDEANRFYEYAAGSIKANRKSLSELQRYLMDTYNAEEFTPSESRYNVFLENLYFHIYGSDEAKWENIDEMIEYDKLHNNFESRQKRLEKIAMTEKKLVYYKISSKEGFDGLQDPDTVVGIDLVSEYFTVSSTNEKTSLDISTYLGVTKEDIETRSIRFMEYAIKLRWLGKI